MTLVSLVPDDATRHELAQYIAAVPGAKSRFHATVFYGGTTPLFQQQRALRLVVDTLPLKVTPPYTLEIFGTDTLALRFESAAFRNLQDALRQEALQQLIHVGLDKPLTNAERRTLQSYATAPSPVIYEQNPHVSLIRGCTEIPPLPPLDRPLRFTRCSWKHLAHKP